MYTTDLSDDDDCYLQEWYVFVFVFVFVLVLCYALIVLFRLMNRLVALASLLETRRRRLPVFGDSLVIRNASDVRCVAHAEPRT